MFFQRMAHVCLHVKNLKRSLDYYHKLGFTDRFQFTRDQGKEFGMYLEIADRTYIEIFEYPDRKPSDNNGLVHFCLETDDLDGVMAHLDAQGISYTPKSEGCDHTWQIWLEDPDGNKFELHQYSDKSMQLKGGVVEANWV